MVGARLGLGKDFGDTGEGEDMGVSLSLSLLFFSGFAVRFGSAEGVGSEDGEVVMWVTIWLERVWYWSMRRR